MKTLNEWQYEIAYKQSLVEKATDLVIEYGSDFEGAEMDIFRKAKADLLIAYENAFQDIIDHPKTLPAMTINVIYLEQKYSDDCYYYSPMQELPEWALPNEVIEKVVYYLMGELIPFGVDFSTLVSAELELTDEYLGELVFTNVNGYEIHVSRIWFDNVTGEVRQYGTQYGNLTI